MERSRLTQQANTDIDTILDEFRQQTAIHIAALPETEADAALDRLYDLVGEKSVDDAHLTQMYADIRSRIADRIGALPERNAWFVQEHLTRFINHGYKEAIEDQRLLACARSRAPGVEFDGVSWSTNPATFEPVMVLRQNGKTVGTLEERRTVFDDPLRVEIRYEIVE